MIDTKSILLSWLVFLVLMLGTSGASAWYVWNKLASFSDISILDGILLMLCVSVVGGVMPLMIGTTKTLFNTIIYRAVAGIVSKEPKNKKKDKDIFKHFGGQDGQ